MSETKKNHFFDLLSSINKTKEDLLGASQDSFTASEYEKAYNAYAINSVLCRYLECIRAVNFVNVNHFLPVIAQYHFLLNTTRTVSRFAKKEELPDTSKLEAIARYYGTSMKTAEQYIKLLSEDQIDYIIKMLPYESAIS